VGAVATSSPFVLLDVEVEESAAVAKPIRRDSEFPEVHFVCDLNCRNMVTHYPCLKKGDTQEDESQDGLLTHWNKDKLLCYSMVWDTYKWHSGFFG
jgi:hypothetical protein